MYGIILVLLSLALGLGACTPPQATAPPGEPPGLIVDSPSISIGVSRQSCTSMEVQAGTEVTWTNEDTVPLRIQLKQLDERGNESDIGGSEVGPGGRFSTQLQEAGTYCFYCSDDLYGTIVVK